MDYKYAELKFAAKSINCVSPQYTSVDLQDVHESLGVALKM